MSTSYKVNLDLNMSKDQIRKIFTDIYSFLKSIENKCMFTYVDEDCISYDTVKKIYFLNNKDDISYEKVDKCKYKIKGRISLESFIKPFKFFPYTGTQILYDLVVIFIKYGHYIVIPFNYEKDFYFSGLPNMKVEDFEKNIFIGNVNLKNNNWQTEYIDEGSQLVDNIINNKWEENSSDKVEEGICKNLDKILNEKYILNKDLLKEIYSLYNQDKLYITSANHNCSNDITIKGIKSLSIDINQPIFLGINQNNDEFVIKINSSSNNNTNIKRVCNYFYDNNYYIKMANGRIVQCLVMEKLNSIKYINNISKFVSDMVSNIEQIHNLSYVHYDIKPDNIMQKSNGDYVLIDYDSISKSDFGYPRQSFTPKFTIWNRCYRELFEEAPIMDHKVHDLIEFMLSLHYIMFQSILIGNGKTDDRINETLYYLCNLEWNTPELSPQIYKNVIKFFL